MSSSCTLYVVVSIWTCIIIPNCANRLFSDDNASDPRRLQFDTTLSSATTPSPTEVTLPPTPIDTLYISNTDPYTLVDFKIPVSWDYANQYCNDRLNTTLASVWRNQTTRLSEMEQINLMAFLCKGNGSTQYPGAHQGGQASTCWIGLRYYQSGSEFFRWIQNGQFLDDDSETFWQPGTDPPTAYFFQAYNEHTVWIVVLQYSVYESLCRNKSLLSELTETFRCLSFSIFCSFS